MVSPEDLERERELARIKVERGRLSRLHPAWLDGGCQHQLKGPLTSNEELLALSLAELRRLAEHLEHEFRSW